MTVRVDMIIIGGIRWLNSMETDSESNTGSTARIA